MGGGEWWWQTKFIVSPGPGLWSLVLAPFGPDLGPGPELDNIRSSFFLQICYIYKESMTETDRHDQIRI